MASTNIYALLIGINEYGQAPLNGCINDVNRMKSYLDSLPPEYKVHDKLLKNSDATKDGIIQNIKEQLGKAGKGDLAMLYFSGHGVQEAAPEWLEDYEHDNKIECIVCYDQEQEQYLLADKEIRYVFNSDELNSGAQLITIFDCCHSGDNTRAIGDYHIPRRLARNFPSRDYKGFIFSGEFEPEDLRVNLNERLPVRQHIHISACRAYEQAYEDQGLQRGIFTNFLCTLLEKRDSNIRYIDIKQIAKMQFSSARDRQIPEIAIRGKGGPSLYDGWLGRKFEGSAVVVRADHTGAQGWTINAGQMHGLEDDDEVKLIISQDDVVTARVAEVMVDKAKLDILNTDDVQRLNEDITYDVDVGIKHRPHLNFALQDLDGNLEFSQSLEKYLADRSQLVADASNFDVVIFNGFVYITNSGNHYRPRSLQLPVRENDAFDMARLGFQMEAMCKAYSVTHLTNLSTSLYKKPPLTISMKALGDKELIDVTGGVFVAKVDPTQNYQVEFEVSIENTSRYPVYVSAAVVSELAGVYTNVLLPEGSIKLEPGEVYEAHKNKRQIVALEPYKRLYNWPDEHIEYKLVVSNHEPVELSSFGQDELEAPLMSEMRSSASKGIRRVDTENRDPDWGTVDFTVRLLNPDYNDPNVVSPSELNSREFGPFARKNFGAE